MIAITGTIVLPAPLLRHHRVAVASAAVQPVVFREISKKRTISAQPERILSIGRRVFDSLRYWESKSETIVADNDQLT